MLTAQKGAFPLKGSRGFHEFNGFSMIRRKNFYSEKIRKAEAFSNTGEAYCRITLLFYFCRERLASDYVIF